MKKFVFACLLGVLVSTTAWAGPVTAPGVELLVNGEPVSVPGEWRTENEKQWFLNVQSTDPTAPLQSLTVAGDIDPFLSYAVGLINPFSTTTTYQLTLLLPYVGGPYNQVTLSHSSTVTDTDVPTNGATVGLNTDPNVSNALVDGVVVTGLGAGCTITPPPASQSCFSGADAVAAVATGVTGTLGVRLNLTLSPNDAYSATGRVTLEEAVVPEPTTMLLVAGGLGAMLAGRRRARSGH